MQELKKEEITRKLDLVVNKLLTLGGPENETELENGGESIGFFRRDFGISEWDWPQGVGLYGLYKIMMVEKKDEYRKFLCSWFKSNMAEGLPSRNINTTTPLLTLVQLNEICPDPEFESLC